MNTTQSLITAKDMPSHKLVVKLEDGTYRKFLLNVRQAQFIADRINSVEQFLVLSRDIDPDAPTAYPKRGAWIEKLSREDLDALRSRYADAARQHVSAEEQAAAEATKKARTAQLRAWVKEHPEEFKKMEQEAAERLLQGKGMYHSASKPVKQYLAHYEALRAVDELLPPQDGDGRKGS